MGGSGARGRRRAGPPRRKEDYTQAPRKDKRPEAKVPQDANNNNNGGIAFPGTGAALRALLSARFCSAIWSSSVADCDETFNYWEPLRYVALGSGLQTWEYSSAAALRSYAALWTFGAPCLLLSRLSDSAQGPTLFYTTRCALGAGSALADLYFYTAAKDEFGSNVARLWLAFSLTGAGGFISAAAMLPSAWCAALSSAALAAWWKRRYPIAIALTALSALLGWPFAALLGLPIAIDLIILRKRPFEFVRWSAISLIGILGPMAYVDSEYYGRLVVAPWNLVKYNILSDRGPDLYGTEPWTFYLLNGFLNFNIVWLSALTCPLLIVLCKLLTNSSLGTSPRRPYWLSLMPLYSWLIVFNLQPHKEERFLFPIYSMICLGGAIAVDCMQKLAYGLVHSSSSNDDEKRSDGQNKKGASNRYISRTKYIMFFFMIVSTLLGLSRNFGQYRYYHAPMDILRGLSEEQVSTDGNITVCYGKEWYRFPSGFLFPDSRYRIGFVKSNFEGMLPAYYRDVENATALAPDYFNDMNKEDPRTHTPLSECHYLVDSTIGAATPLEPRYADDVQNWTLVKSLPFLDAAASHRLFRAFYVPLLSDGYVAYGEVQLLRSAKLKLD